MKKWLPHLIILLIIIAGVWYMRTHQRTQPAPTTPSADNQVADAKTCAEFRDVATIVQNLKPNNNSIETSRSSDTHYFAFKRAATEPYVVYESHSSVGYNFQPDTIDRVQQALITTAIPEIAKLGLERDTTQDSIQSNGFTEPKDQAYLTGLRKGDDRYMIVIDNLTSGNHDIIEISIECGRTDAKWDKRYDDFISNSQYLTSQVIGPVSDKEGLYMISTHAGFAGGGGATEYWTRKDSKPRKIFVGQDYPPCETLESFRVGKGTECLEAQSMQTRTVTY